MLKKLSLMGVLCIGLVAFGDSNALANGYLGGQWRLGSFSPLYFDSTWSGNTDTTLTNYDVILMPIANDDDYPIWLKFRNHGGGTGGEALHWNNDTVPVVVNGDFSKSVSGKGKIYETITFGDCDQCDAIDPDTGGYVYELPDEGILWFLFDKYACGSQGPHPVFSGQAEAHAYYEPIIECIKDGLVTEFAPNDRNFEVFAVEIRKFDAFLSAYFGGALKVTADFQSCKLNSVTLEFECDVEFINRNL